MLILALLEQRPRHGYELSKLIEARSGGELRFHVASFYPLLYRLRRGAGSPGGGWKRRGSGGGGSTARPAPGGGCWRGSGGNGGRLCARWSGSREWNMPEGPDWRAAAEFLAAGGGI